MNTNKQHEREALALVEELNARVRELGEALEILLSANPAELRWGDVYPTAEFKEAREKAKSALERLEREAQAARDREKARRAWARVDALIAQEANQ